MKYASYFIILIVLVGFVIRFIGIDTNPPSAYGDEISFGVNAWSILKSGTDEYGTYYPLQFKAFGDYKSPLPVYLLVPFFAFFGMSTFSLRLPIVIFAAATIWILYLLVRELSSNKMGLTAAFLLCVSWWHIHLSRGFFEATLALFFLVAGVYFFMRLKPTINHTILSAIFFLASLYSYFTPRIIVPMLVVFLCVRRRQWLLSNKKNALSFIVVLLLGIVPLLYLSLFNGGASRIKDLASSREQKITQAVILDRSQSAAPHALQVILYNKYFYWVREFTVDYFEHLSPSFLFLSGDSSLRYFLGSTGMMYVIEMPLLVAGIIFLYRKHRGLFYLCLFWILVAPLPAALVGRPFAVRSLNLLPPLLILVAGGLVWLVHLATIRKYRFLILIPVVLYTLSFGYRFVRYNVDYPIYAATWWGWENKAAINLALKDSSQYDQIFISNYYTGAELAFAFYTAYDPVLYRQAKQKPVTLADGRQFTKLGKFYFGSLDIDEKRQLEGIIPPKSLYIGRPEEAPSAEVIKAPNDGRILFNVLRTK